MKKSHRFSGGFFISEIKQFFKSFVQGDAQNQRQFGGGVELPRFDGTDGVVGHAHRLGQLPLRQFFSARASLRRFFRISFSSIIYLSMVRI